MLTERQKGLFLDKVKETGFIELAARWAGIPLPKLKEYCLANQDFKRAVCLARQYYFAIQFHQIKQHCPSSERHLEQRLAYELRLKDRLTLDKNCAPPACDCRLDGAYEPWCPQAFQEG